jgi:soluble lytic murein transglycosylase-like protein
VRSPILAALLAVAALGLPGGAQAAPDPDAPPPPSRLALLMIDSQVAMATARADADQLRAQPAPSDVVGQLRLQMLIADADFRYRSSVRDEQVLIYGMAVDPAVEAGVLHRLPADRAVGLEAAIGALRSLWRSAGIDNLSEIKLRNNRSLVDSAPVDTLIGLYRAAGRNRVDWTYLASINFIESDFGRVNGPSSAGALGPMQFMPGTWQDYGAGGDVMSPNDSIQAAAVYLNRMGAPANMDRAIFRYNNDYDYVAAVQGFAGAIRSDQTWFSRLYYWSTFG